MASVSSRSFTAAIVVYLRSKVRSPVKIDRLTCFLLVSVRSSENVERVRPFILAFLVSNVDLSDETKFKRFLRLQNDIHDDICQKRTLASLGTHDVASIQGNLVYELRPSDEIRFIPLGNGTKVQTGKEFYEKLGREAEQERKARKRNQLSGLYKFVREELPRSIVCFSLLVGIFPWSTRTVASFV